jgi:Family of unknown function (DUF6874)
MAILCWEVSREDADLILQCAVRARGLYEKQGVSFDTFECDMDLTACHANGCPMDFAKLLAAPDFDFIHDVAGIRRHINRETGQIENCFMPRCHGRATGGKCE